MTEPILNQGTPKALDPKEQAEIDSYIQAINTNPQLGQVLLSRWRKWKKGKIVAPGTIEDRMWAAYCEGANTGIRVAATAILMSQREIERQLEEQENTHEEEVQEDRDDDGGPGSQVDGGE